MSGDDKYKDEKMRCSVLGGDVGLNYCLKMEGGKPCSSAEACWKESGEEIMNAIKERKEKEG